MVWVLKDGRFSPFSSFTPCVGTGVTMSSSRSCCEGGFGYGVFVVLVLMKTMARQCVFKIGCVKKDAPM